MHNNPLFFRVIGMGLLVALAGCDSWSEWRRQSAIETVEKTVKQQLGAMSLVAIKHGTKPSGPERLRILVTPDAVHVDNGAYLADLEEADLAALAEKAGEELVVHVTGLDTNASAVAPAVKKGLAVEQKTFASLDTYVGRAEVWADASVPFLTLAKVLAGAAEGGVEKFRFAVEGPEGPRFFNAEAVTDCAQVEFAKKARVGISGFCAVPEIEVRSEGLLVRTRRRLAEGKGCKGEVELGPKKLEWDGRMMLPDKKACPSVPTVEEGQDTKGLVKLLKKIAAIVPGCSSAVITAGPDVTWDQAAAVVAATTANSTFVHTGLVTEGARAPGADLDCSNGMSPQDLPVVAERLAKAARDVNRLSIMGHLDDLDEPE